MIRVLHILDKISYSSGVSNVILNYYFYMDHSKIQFDFLINEPVKEKELYLKIKNTGSQIFILSPLNMKNLYKYKKDLFLFFKNHSDYKIVHGHMPNLAFLYLKAAKKYNIPVRIIHCHTTRGGSTLKKRIRNDICKEFGLKHATHFFACSEEAGRYLVGKNQNKKIVYLKNAIDTSKFKYSLEQRTRIRRELKLDTNFVLGHIGRFSSEKNHIFLLEIVEKLIREKMNIKLLLVGDGELKDEIIQITKNKGLENYVVFAGQQKDIGSYLSAMDLFVFPSFFEGTPVSVIEAQTNALYCLISDTITKEVKITELIEYVTISSVEVWTKKIISLILSSKSHKNNLDIRFEQNEYNITYASKILSDVYNKMIEENI